MGVIFTYGMQDRVTIYHELDKLLEKPEGVNNISPYSTKVKYVMNWLQHDELEDGITLDNTIQNKYLGPFIDGKEDKNLTSILVSKEGVERIVVHDIFGVMSKKRQSSLNPKSVEEFLRVADFCNNTRIFKLSDDLYEVNQTLENYYPNYTCVKDGYPKKFFFNEWNESQKKYPLQVALRSTGLTPLISNFYIIKKQTQKEFGGFSMVETGVGGGFSYVIGGLTVLLPVITFAGLYNVQQYLKHQYYYGSLIKNIGILEHDIKAINIAIKNVNLAKKAFKNLNENDVECKQE